LIGIEKRKSKGEREPFKGRGERSGVKNFMKKGGDPKDSEKGRKRDSPNPRVRIRNLQ